MEEECVISQGIERTLPAEEPTVAAAPPVPPLGDVFDDDPTSFDDYAILGLPSSSYASVLGDDNEDGEAYDDLSDSDSEIEDHDNQVRFWDHDAARSETDLVAEPLMFLSQMTRFASFQGATNFMHTSAAQASTGGEDNHEGGVIIVHYCLTLFSGTQSSGLGAVLDFGKDLHHVRYLVPFPVAATDPVSSLRLVGATLAADVYSHQYYMQLQALWSSLVAVMPVCVLARATHFVVTVDVGVLRGEDRTPERMREALEALARENDSSPMAYCLEQHLLVPVCYDGESGGGGDRPAKRMKRFAVTGEVCAICHEALEHGLAAWPWCSHVFHGKCLELLLVTVQHRCPMSIYAPCSHEKKFVYHVFMN
ncbi:unnamed protein product [Miscanthus lutarioriparius]|uniref:RING-type domain-containing protein n=1 Tax=Miscanthus lutarioriparius TaxID=422564 RepID=A0A811QAH9_9POAL|nr:unnamed protein product [Miscanthus lutarioriparius]